MESNETNVNGTENEAVEQPVKLSHEEIKKAILSGFGLLNVAGEVYEDKKVDLADLKSLPALGITLSELTKVDFKVVSAQFKDLDKAEIDDIHASVVEKFDIPQDEIEEKIELALGAVIELSQAVIKCVEVFKAFKK